MCGVVAVWDPELASQERRRWAEALASRLVHRGPDGAGVWDAPHAPLTLAHRRLAIRGLGEQGQQPMTSDAGTLVYNGELFATQTLRERLAHEGLHAAGTSDTELLLLALTAWGMPGALAHLQGQFAFAFYETRQRALYFARDRLGVRPLYYAAQGAKLALASEQKGLLPLPWIDRELAQPSALRFLALARTDDVPGETMLRGVQSLPPGHWAMWNGTSLERARYWRLESDPPRTDIAEVARHLERAVGEQLVSDVPLGAMVSGGLDSSAVVCLADRARLAQQATQPLHLFAYHDSVAAEDERPYQQAILDAVQSPKEVHWVSSSTAELERDFDTYVAHQEEPFGDVSSYAEYCIARRAAQQGVKVLLSGLGGDEVFAGYSAFLGPLVNEALGSGQIGVVLQVLRRTPEILRLHPLRGGAYAMLTGLYYALPPTLRRKLTAMRGARAAGLGRAHMLATARALGSVTAAARPVNEALLDAIESWSVPRYLMHSDRMGLAHGVENRVPLLNPALIAAGFGLPVEQRIGPFGLKEGLRRAVGEYLPVLVRERRWKLGFHVPVKAYVTALNEPLRAGYDAAREWLGEAPPWDDLPPLLRWRWGALGLYRRWARAYPQL